MLNTAYHGIGSCRNISTGLDEQLVGKVEKEMHYFSSFLKSCNFFAIWRYGLFTDEKNEKKQNKEIDTESKEKLHCFAKGSQLNIVVFV